MNKWFSQNSIYMQSKINNQLNEQNTNDMIKYIIYMENP